MVKNNIRYDYRLIAAEIPEGAKVLDLGCGDGTLLEYLQKVKKIQGFGVEIDEENVARCIQKGIYCYQGDIDEGLADYRANSFDYVIMNQVLTNTRKTDYVLQEVMRISQKAIISFMNFGQLKIRLQFLTSGKMPITKDLPFQWYDSPNIHMVTISDFEAFCQKANFSIEKRHLFSLNKNYTKAVNFKVRSNLFAKYGLYVLNGEKFL